MSVYSISLFLHIVGALGLVAVLAVEWAGLAQLRRAARVVQVRDSVRLLAGPRVLGGPAALLILLTGIHMTATRWGPRGWIIVGLAGMVIIAILGAAMGARRTGAIARALPADDGPIAPALAAQVRDPALVLGLRLRVALFLGVVFLMATEPGTGASLAAMAVAALVGAAPSPGRGRSEARVTGSER